MQLFYRYYGVYTLSPLMCPQDLLREIREIQDSKDAQIQAIKATASSAEQRADSAREERRVFEERLSRVKIDLETEFDARLRETVKKTRIDIEEEWRDRLKGTERRLLEEIDNLKIELAVARRRADDAERDAEISRKKVVAVKEEGVNGALAEFDRAQRAQVELEELCQQQKDEIKRMREDHISISERLASALLQMQVAASDAENAKADAKIAVTDSQTIHSALVQATQRLHDADLENMKLRSEVALMKQQLETKTVEVTKLQGVQMSTGERASSSDLENRRIKTKYEAEVARLSSKVTELEVMNSILREEVAKVSNTEKQSNRDLEQALDRKEFDISRLRERLQETELRCDAHSRRIVQLEKEIATSQDILFSKDLCIRDEKQKTESAGVRLEEVKRRFEAEVNGYRQQLQDEKLKNAEVLSPNFSYIVYE
jgi:chromosome segregation ATPase